MKKIVFIVQGEGSSHLTQARSLAEAAIKEGHEIKWYISNSVPVDIGTYYTQFKSFKLIFDKDGIDVFKTLTRTISKIGTIVTDYIRIRKEIIKYKPDLIINCYEPLAAILPRKFTIISIAHQYKFIHPDYSFPSNFIHNKMFKIFTWFTSISSKQIYALSWYPMERYKNIDVIPPILRKEAYDGRVVKQDDYILSYCNNQDYTNQIIQWAKDSNQKLILYYQGEPKVINEITLHPLSDDFTKKMKSCLGFVSNAGFESISEALLWKKNVFVSPIKNQYEQKCNAHDLRSNSLGTIGRDFKQVYFHPNPTDVSSWIKSGKFICTKLLKNVL